MLARLISANQVILLSTGSTLFLFYQNEVHKRETTYFTCLPTHQINQDYPIWTLINVDALRQAPLIDSTHMIWPIQASSPNPSRWKTWSKQRNAAELGMPLWDVDELMAGYVLVFSVVSPNHIIRFLAYRSLFSQFIS